MAKTRLIKKILGLLLLSFFVALFFTPLDAKAATATLSFSPNSISKNPGESFSVNIIINVIDETATGATIDILYNSSVLESPSYTYVAPGGGFCIAPNENSQAGHFRFSLACSPGWTKGSNTLATVSFKAKSAGTTSLSFYTSTNPPEPQTIIAGDNGNFIFTKSTATINVLSQTSSSPVSSNTSSAGTSVTTKTPTKSTGNSPKPTTVAPGGGSSQPSQQSTTQVQQSSQATTNTNNEEKKITPETKNGLFNNLFQGLDEQSQVLIEGVITRVLYILTVIILVILTLAFSVYFIWGRKV